MRKISVKQASVIPLAFIIIGIIFSVYYYSIRNWSLLELFFSISFMIVIGAGIYGVIWAFLLKRNLLKYEKPRKSKLQTILIICLLLFIGISFLIWGITTALDPNTPVFDAKPIIKIILFGGLLVICLIYYLIQKLIKKVLYKT